MKSLYDLDLVLHYSVDHDAWQVQLELSLLITRSAYTTAREAWHLVGQGVTITLGRDEVEAVRFTRRRSHGRRATRRPLAFLNIAADGLVDEMRSAMLRAARTDDAARRLPGWQ